MSVPNFKQTSLVLQKLLRDPKNSKLGDVTQATPIYESLYIPYAGGIRHLCSKSEADRSIRSKVINGVPKFGI